MKTIFRAFVDECQALLHSIAGLTVLVMGVLFYSVLYPQPYLHQAPQKLPLLVVDRDRTTTSRTLLRLLDSTEGAPPYTTTRPRLWPICATARDRPR